MLPELNDESVEMTLTDIPYGIVSRSSNGLRVLDKDVADIETFDINTFVNQLVRVTKGSIYIFCSTEQVSLIRALMVESALSTRLCIWEKSNPSPMNGQYIWLSGIECCVYGKKRGATFNEHCKNTVWKYPVERRRRHYTPKPLRLFEYLIKASSNESDIILDPCIGSGTTAVAAINTARQFIGFELNSDILYYAKDRLMDTSFTIKN